MKNTYKIIVAFEDRKPAVITIESDSHSDALAFARTAFPDATLIK